MELTSQTTLRFPAAYAPISEEEMIYIDGGDSISPQQFTFNLVTNLARLLGQAMFDKAITGLNNMRNDGLTYGGAIKHYWGRQNNFGKAMTFVGAGLVGYAMYIYAVQMINTALGIYTDVKDAYLNGSSSSDTSQQSSDATAAATAALTAA